MFQPKISIITATFNREMLIERAIQSVLSQDYPNWELIISDDGSKDNTEHVVAPYIEDKRIIYIRSEKNQGVNHARNRAIEQSNGDWTVLLDSDNALTPDSLSGIVQTIEEYPSIGMHFFRVQIFEGPVLGTTIPSSTIMNAKEYLRGKVQGEFYPVVRSDLIRRKLFFEDINGGEGILWSFFILKLGNVCFHPMIAEYYGIEGSDRLSIKGTNRQRLYQVFRKDIEQLWKSYLMYCPQQLLIRVLKMFYYRA
jgi:GalNAc5-diNAcBac-PP-undecaprenol beta-1,3-glucosyltransferase